MCLLHVHRDAAHRVGLSLTADTCNKLHVVYDSSLATVWMTDCGAARNERTFSALPTPQSSRGERVGLGKLSPTLYLWGRWPLFPWANPDPIWYKAAVLCGNPHIKTSFICLGIRPQYLNDTTHTQTQARCIVYAELIPHRLNPALLHYNGQLWWSTRNSMPLTCPQNTNIS